MSRAGSQGINPDFCGSARRHGQTSGSAPSPHAVSNAVSCTEEIPYAFLPPVKKTAEAARCRQRGGGPAPIRRACGQPGSPAAAGVLPPLSASSACLSPTRVNLLGTETYRAGPKDLCSPGRTEQPSESKEQLANPFRTGGLEAATFGSAEA